MYVWTRKDIAAEYGVSASTPHGWINAWGPESEHPFPEPVAMVQMKSPSTAGWTLKQLAYNPREVRAWHADLAEAQSKRMSASHVPAAQPQAEVHHNAPVSRPMQEAVSDMENALVALKETRRELERLSVLVDSVRPVDRSL